MPCRVVTFAMPTGLPGPDLFFRSLCRCLRRGGGGDITLTQIGRDDFILFCFVGRTFFFLVFCSRLVFTVTEMGVEAELSLVLAGTTFMTQRGISINAAANPPKPAFRSITFLMLDQLTPRSVRYMFEISSFQCFLSVMRFSSGSLLVRTGLRWIFCSDIMLEFEMQIEREIEEEIFH